ncbi:hypothetical protein M0804_007173 [Polistes exclamans]|nr:hypothetical protein M0804_007173 [Polistes exclamans]
MSTLMVGKFFTSKYNLDLLVEIFAFLMPNLCYYCGYCTFHFKLKKIKKLFDIIKCDWEELTNPEEIAIIEKYAIKSKYYTIILAVIFSGFLFMIALSYLLPRLLDIVVPLNETRKPTVIIPVETFCKIEETIYGIILIIIIVACLGITAVAVYGSFLLFIQHTCGMLSLTGFFDYVKDASEECYTIQISLALILVASDYVKLMQIKTSILGENIDDVTICIIHVMGIMFSLFINCHAGQQIIDHSNYVFYKAKIAPWYLVSTKIQKSGLIILMRSQKICYLSVGGTFVSSYEFFLSILHTQLTIENGKEIMTSIMHIIGNLAWAFLNCYFGQKVIDRSAEVHTKIFNTPWYVLNKKSQILLWFMMARSTKPCYLSSGHYFYVSIQFFASINQILKLIKQNWFEKEHSEEFQIMKKYAEDVLTYGLILTAISISAIPFILDMYFPLNQTRHLTLPFPMEFFLDIQKHFILILVITFVMSSITCTAVVANYTLFAVLIYNICGMFCVVGVSPVNSLIVHLLSRNMLDDIRKDILYDHYTEDKVYAKIIRSIKYHKKTLEFYIPWYVLSTKSKTLLLFMMMRSLKPCYFVLVNFVNLSVQLSMSVIKTTLSYAMVIYSVQ